MNRRSFAGERIACLWMPRFALAALRPPTAPSSTPQPAALYQPTGRWNTIVECDPVLEVAELRPGTPLKEAQARWPDALFIPYDLSRASHAFLSVVEILDRFSPTVEKIAPGLAFLDSSGLAALYGPDVDLARRIKGEVESETDQAVAVGIADNCFTAMVAARVAGGDHGERILIVPSECSAAFLAPQPIELLPVPEKSLPRLLALGLRTIGDFAALPANAVTHRLGADSHRILLAARGEDPRTLKPPLRPLVLTDEIEFEWSEESRDRLIFALKALADRLARRLDQHGLACRQLRVRWSLDDGSACDRILPLAEASANPTDFVDHLRWHVEGLTLTSPVTMIGLTATDVAPLTGRQLTLPSSLDR
ncbi:MAG TPA: DNA polymerase Y family protein, partial [Chloroflexota bacterium]|nr:DNA polymerase Y family protein [Chloroflexota bacterium]